MGSVTPVADSRLLLVVVWLFFIVAALGYLSRVLIKLRMSDWSVRARTADDWFLDAALPLALAQSLATSFQANSGFGDKIATADGVQIHNIEKAGYTADLFYVLALCFTKFSGIAFCHGMTPVTTHKTWGRVIGAFTLIWTISAVFTLIFRCSPPEVWNTARKACIDLRAWWLFFEASNGLVELAIAAYPLYIISNLQTSIQRRFVIAVRFTPRIVVASACFVKVGLLASVSGNPAVGPGWWRVAVCTQAIMSTAILAACALYIKDLLDSMHSGFFEGGDLRRQGQDSVTIYYRSREGSREAQTGSNKTSTGPKTPSKPQTDFGVFSTSRSISLADLPKPESRL